MKTKKVIRILEHSHRYSEATVEKAIRECLRGRHGEFLKRVLLRLAENGLRDAGADDEQVRYVRQAMVDHA